ncbi:MAG: ATP-dependent Clp protease ATP-binding subunit ClpX [Chloroflexi bacterium]|nr:ATP-dependent Clp protease ATP-binding subunit ClpX [Chloroflexota bacterium]MCI0784686.1 ATP-dependent Clp protease ATP-binding subunit ClpX [Chloroflexota bacterium]MCI0791943.1 ATP-dependent Clp protease ATP-binding subunit ClpX [Chloroflexota bacterium]MCI0798187.1 ATP-dependent Clp protease ATP-binding subunit ClpX [Chloroflexota bacterium]MCI0824126.1 ATP-dependent Clp protease ATP-binding subunit ClpX [Chloroflexota bacterium]
MASTRNGSRRSQCSFCEKVQARSDLIIAGQGRAAVCYDCIRVLGQLVNEESPPAATTSNNHGPLVPREIYANLDTYVVGQDRAKKILSVAVYNHFKRIWNVKKKSDVELQKTNILLMGPTGCGKTLLAETLARTLEVPFAVCDATSLTESGYVGEDVENILLRLIQAADWDVSKAEHGIIYIDELDKIARKEGVNRSITRDVSGEGVQQELLKIIEGCVANVPPQGGRKHPHQEFLQINTKNILFICGGSFDGLEEVVSKRLASGSTQLGFLAGNRGKNGAEIEGNPLQFVTPEDLLQFGFIPEMVGRLPVTVSLEPLDRDDLLRVLTEPKNAIVKQYQQLFAMDGVELEFTTDGLEAAAERAQEHHTGARCLRYVIEETLLDVMYELPSLGSVVRCVVDRKAIEGISDPCLLTENGETVSLSLGPVQKSA